MENKLNIQNTNRALSIISDDCFGGHIYQNYNQIYSSPFIGLYITDSDYIKMLKNLHHYLSSELTFTSENNISHPLGVLDDIKVFFLHYNNQNDTKLIWNRRLARFNFNNIAIKFATEDSNLLHEFDKLPFENKIAFSPKDYNFKSCHVINGWNNANTKIYYHYDFRLYVQDKILNDVGYFDWKQWFNKIIL